MNRITAQRMKVKKLGARAAPEAVSSRILTDSPQLVVF